jgi:hypothetical protein
MNVSAKSMTYGPSLRFGLLDVDHLGCTTGTLGFPFAVRVELILNLHLHETETGTIHRSETEQG